MNTAIQGVVFTDILEEPADLRPTFRSTAFGSQQEPPHPLGLMRA
jgi:hypothetical protein